MIWQFGERGYDFSIDSLGRLGEKPPKWEYMNDPSRIYLYNFYAAIMDLRKNHAVFQTDDFTMNAGSRLKRIILRHTDMNVVVVGNFDVEAGEVSGEFPHTGWWYDYFTGDSLNVKAVNDMISLEAGEYHLFTDVRLQTPDIGTGIIDHPGSDLPYRLNVYPNPAMDYIAISGYQDDQSSSCADTYHIEIHDLSGRITLEKAVSSASGSWDLDISSLQGGMYLLIVRENGDAVARNKITVMK